MPYLAELLKELNYFLMYKQMPIKNIKRKRNLKQNHLLFM